MIVELGHFALALAVAVAVLQMLVPVAARWLRLPQLLAMSAPAAVLQLALLLAAFLALTWAYVVSDFSVENVWANSHSTKPLIYRISGVWGNHEGSMLLWVLILAAFGALVAVFGGNLPQSLKSHVLAVQASIALAFAVFILTTSNPFQRLAEAPIEGRGLNPILQDPGLAFHPPLLYAGYVGLLDRVLVRGGGADRRADRCGVGALGQAVDAGVLDVPDGRHRDGLVVGLLRARLGRLVVLGPGRERLADAVAGGDRAAPFRGRDGEAGGAEGLDDPARDPGLLAVADGHVPGALGRADVGACVRGRSGAGRGDPGDPRAVRRRRADAVRGARRAVAAGRPVRADQREGALVVNNVLLTLSCATVFIGTLYPLALDAIAGARISVGPPYFNATFGPLMLALLVAVPLGPMLAWKRGDLMGALQRLKFAGIIAFAAFLAALALGRRGPWLAPIVMAVGVWVIAGAISELAQRVKLGSVPFAETLSRLKGLPRSAFGTMVAHVGAGTMLIGIVATSAWQSENVLVMKPGETTSIARLRAHLQGRRAAARAELRGGCGVVRGHSRRGAGDRAQPGQAAL